MESGTIRPSLQGRRRGGGVHLAGAFTLLAYVALAWRSHGGTHVPVGLYLAAVAVAWLALVGALVASRRAPRFPLAAILGWGIAFRAVALSGQPLLEDDHYRYLWDGRMFALTGTPYATRPADHFTDPTLSPRFARILDRVNHPDLPTIYGPTSQLAFLGAYWIAPGSLLPLKVLLVLAEAAVVVCILRLRAPPAGMLLWAWCPLAVQEIAFSAHPDALGVAPLLAALLLARRHPWAAGALCGVAAGARVLALVVAPFALARGGWRAGVAFAAALAMLYGPFLLAAGGSDRAALAVFLDDWEFNSLAFAPLRALLGSRGARLASALVLGGIVLWFLAAARRTGTALPRGDLLYGALFLLSPVVNPWYLLWLLAFVALRPTLWGAAALAAVPLSYFHGGVVASASLAPYEHPVWVRPAEILVVLLAAAIEQVRRRADIERHAQ
jgi:hypothetical protein